MTTERKGIDKDSPFSLVKSIDIGKRTKREGWLRFNVGWDHYDMNPGAGSSAARESQMVDVHVDATLADLRKKIGRIGCVDEPALLCEGKGGDIVLLMDEWKSLEDLGLQDGDIILARNPCPPGSEIWVDD
eukprot:TRINITY_DN31974_c0_g1_i1.p3 TRINITY_DN31974_c0_g1~~TRINITY_DN31974_c0_g1_i1.p3  ORF type:complete len:131 (+),score=42.25 TRINITY_DN31974_c0_g1_i1:62-454(+)